MGGASVARHPSGFHRLLAAGALAGCLGSAAGAATPAAAASAPLSDAQVATIAANLGALLARPFQLSGELKLDPELRAQADAIGAAHVARIRQLLPDWIRDEQRQQAAENVPRRSDSVYAGVWARLLNELALWQIEPGDPAYERATLEVLKTAPQACELEGDGPLVDFAGRVLRLQAMPPAQRQVALATERELLAHWGKPRAALAPWPDPLPQEAAMALVARMRVEGATPALALSPSLASAVLVQPQDYADLPLATQCQLQQWWLRVSLAQGATPAAALDGFRYGTMLTATVRMGQGYEAQNPEATARAAAAAAAKGTPAYPRMAVYFDINGKTTVRRRLDAAGKPIQASVVKRDITVRGIRGVRPVAFETTFDALSMKYGLSAQVTSKPAADNSQMFQMVWMLDPDDPAPDAGSKPQGGAK
jgi:hypothetical protein